MGLRPIGTRPTSLLYEHFLCFFEHNSVFVKSGTYLKYLKKRTIFVPNDFWNKTMARAKRVSPAGVWGDFFPVHTMQTIFEINFKISYVKHPIFNCNLHNKKIVFRPYMSSNFLFSLYFPGPKIFYSIIVILK